jgi:hypothetical protein
MIPNLHEAGMIMPKDVFIRNSIGRLMAAGRAS